MPYNKNPSYLWQHSSGCWFIKRPIPPKLQHHYPNEKTGKNLTHLVETLGTHSHAEAEKRKRAPLRLIESTFARLVSGVMSPTLARHHDKLKEVRQQIAESTEADEARIAAGGDELDDPLGIGILEEIAAEVAEQIGKVEGPKAARAAYVLAVQPGTLSLKEALAERHKGASLREQTKAAEVKALADLLAYMKVGDCLPRDVTGTVAMNYVDSLNDGDLSHATKKGKVSCLGRLWSMKKVRTQLRDGAPNPWLGHDVKGERKSTDEVNEEESGRVWTEDEIVKVFTAPDEADRRKRTYTRWLFRELHVLGLVTGMRLDEITSLRASDVGAIKDGLELQVRKAKTKAGIRQIPVVHPAAVAILKARGKAQTDPRGMLFSECAAGGPDNKTSWHVSKALGRDRVKLGLTEVTFHSTRGTFMTVQENAGTNVVHVQRYVGHAIDTVMHKTYSGGSSVATLRAVAGAATYSAAVEAELAKVAAYANAQA
jgi:integrase